MAHRFGGKFGSRHCTLTPEGAAIADIAAKCTHVKRVIHGAIIASRKSSGGSRKVKIRENEHALEVHVIAGASVQVMYVYVIDVSRMNDVKEYIKAGAERVHYTVQM